MGILVTIGGARTLKTTRHSALGSVIGFVSVLVAAEVGARAIAPGLPVEPGKWPRAEMAQKLEQIRSYLDDDEDLDVIFAGSSMTADGIDPVTFSEISGVSSYNAGWSGASLRTITPWIVDIIQPLVEPEVVVVGLSSRELSDNSSQHARVHAKLLESPGYKEATSNIALELAGGLERLSYFLGYRRAFREPTQLLEGSERIDAANDVKEDIGPFGRRNNEPRDYWIPKGFARMIRQKIFGEFSVGGREYEALAELARELEEEDVKLVVINMPVADYYVDIHRADQWAAYQEALTRAVEELGVTFVDAQDALPTRAFRNPIHIDIDARDAFAEALAQSWDELIASEGETFSMECDGPRECAIL